MKNILSYYKSDKYEDHGKLIHKGKADNIQPSEFTNFSIGRSSMNTVGTRDPYGRSCSHCS